MSKLFTYYFSFIFIVLFLVSYPAQLVIIQNKKWHKYGHYIIKNNIKILLFASFFKLDIIGSKNIKKGINYIFCSNHSSYFDILSLYLIPGDYFKFLGKSSLEKIPLFGHLYKKLYITVNRRDKGSRTKALDECEKSLKNNIGIAIYPEGAIPINTPELIHFKDGAFKLSIENQTPIIPITLPFNHKILPVGGGLKRHRIKIIIHKPLNTKEKPINSISELRDKTYQVISDELKMHGVI